MNNLFRFVVTVSLPPKTLSPNSRPHWAAKAKAVKEHRGESALCTKIAMNCARGEGRTLDVTEWKEILVRPTMFHRVNRRRDRDNAQSSLKAAFDGIAQELGVDDSLFVIAPVKFEIDKADPRVEIELTELAE